MRFVANRVVGGLLALTPLTALSQANSAIEACTKLTDEHARLACFDREVGAQMAREAHAATAAPPAAAVAPPAPALASKLTDEQKMGLTPGRIQQLERPADAPPPLQALTVKITNLTTDLANHQIFTLENGQVWRQVELDGSFTVKAGDVITISRGAMGSYFMSFGKHRNTRVSRVH
jgi:hypothetical protein